MGDTGLFFSSVCSCPVLARLVVRLSFLRLLVRQTRLSLAFHVTTETPSSFLFEASSQEKKFSEAIT